jgi:large subunit ribosomal protein L25
MLSRRLFCTSAAVAPLALSASVRAASGSNVSRKLRASGRVPGVIFGGSAPSVLVHFSEDEMEKALAASPYENPAADISIDSSAAEKNVSIHQVLRHPVSRKIVSVNVWRGPKI